MLRCAFYLVADASYFVGAAAALNSLRLCGHRDDAYVLDVGLTAEQRAALARAATVLPAPENVAPRLAKWVAPLAHPADVMVVMDADVIVTRPLDPLLEQAAEGSLVAFADDRPDIHHEEWAQFVGLDSLPRRTFVNAGLIVLPGGLGLEVLQAVKSLQMRLAELGHTRIRTDDREGLWAYPDQEAWNAVFGATVAAHAFRIWPRELAPFEPPRSAAVVDERELDVRSANGDRPFLVHYIGSKPWLGKPAVAAYTELLPRVLFWDDVVLRFVPDDLPRAFRPGLRGASWRIRMSVQSRFPRFARSVGDVLRFLRVME